MFKSNFDLGTLGRSVEYVYLMDCHKTLIVVRLSVEVINLIKYRSTYHNFAFGSIVHE